MGLWSEDWAHLKRGMPIGVGKSVAKMKEAGYAIPAWVQEMLDSGKESFYKKEAGPSTTMISPPRTTRRFPLRPGIILLPSLKEREKGNRRKHGRFTCRYGGRRGLSGISRQNECHWGGYHCHDQ